MAAARGYLYGGDSGGGRDSGFNSVQLTNNKRVSCSSSSKPLDSFFVSGSSHFGGSRSMVSFEDNRNGSSGLFFRTFDHEENGDDEYDDYFQHPAEKKRRLKADQVEFLEKSFETENKLEPERKIQLAKDLGLQPRQIAIWFQNRRARWKTKQLEKDYDVLQESYNQLKANYENLLQEKEKLKSEVLDLSDKLLLQQQTEKGTCEYSSSTTKSPSQPLHQEPVADCVNDEHQVSKTSNGAYFQDVLSESSCQKYIDGPISIGDSSYLFDQDQSDESLDEEDNLEKMFVTPVVSGYMLPKIENDDYPVELDAVNSCYLQLGFHGNYNGHSDHDHQDQSFGFWSY